MSPPCSTEGVPPALTLTNISKSFGSTRALDQVGFNTRPSSVHALLGGNGSGKSTLIKILAGVYQADGGQVTIGSEKVAATEITPQVARQHGLRFVHQNPGLFSNMSVADNLALGSGYPTRAARIVGQRLRERSAELLKRFEIPAEPESMLGELRPAAQTMVAVARALGDIDSGAAAVLVLDEPTASLPAHEVDLLFAAIRRLSAQGQSIIFVTHRIEEVLALADEVTVLRDGRHAVSRPRAGLDEPQLIEHIVGRKLAQSSPVTSRVEVRSDEPVLLIEGLSGGPLKHVDLTVHAGEVVGVAGLLGSGRTELLRMIFGAYPRQAGTMRLAGRPFRPVTPSAAMIAGVAYVPEDRGKDAAFADLSVQENMSIARLRRYWRRLAFDRRAEARDARQGIVDFAVKTSDHHALFSELSGGNQQKVVLARWLQREPTLLLLDEPTQGVDVQARADIYAFIRTRVAAGLAAVVVSSDFEELSRSCDRVVVLSNGVVTATLRAPHLEAQRLTELVYTGEAA